MSADGAFRESRMTTHEPHDAPMADCLKIDLGLIGYEESLKLQQRLVAARKASIHT